MKPTPMTAFHSAPPSSRVGMPKGEAKPYARKLMAPFAETARAESRTEAARRGYIGFSTAKVDAIEAERDSWVAALPLDKGPMSRQAILDVWGNTDNNRIGTLVSSGRLVIVRTHPTRYGLPGTPVFNNQTRIDDVFAAITSFAQAPKEIAKASGVEVAGVYFVLEQLVQEGKVKRLGPNKRHTYALPGIARGISLPVAPWEAKA